MFAHLIIDLNDVGRRVVPARILRCDIAEPNAMPHGWIRTLQISLGQLLLFSN